MAGIETYLEQIKNAIYGKDVRQAIHDGIEECYKDGKAGAVDLVARQQIAELVAPSGEAPSAAEVTDARVGADGVSYISLGTANRSQFDRLKNATDGDNELFNIYKSVEFVNSRKQTTVSGEINSDGNWQENAAKSIDKFAVSEGELVYIEKGAGTWQFQSAASIPYRENTNIVGVTHLADSGFFVAPSGAIFLMLTRASSDTKVYAKKVNRLISKNASENIAIGIHDYVQGSYTTSGGKMVDSNGIVRNRLRTVSPFILECGRSIQCVVPSGYEIALGVADTNLNFIREIAWTSESFEFIADRNCRVLPVIRLASDADIDAAHAFNINLNALHLDLGRVNSDNIVKGVIVDGRYMDLDGALKNVSQGSDWCYTEYSDIEPNTTYNIYEFSRKEKECINIYVNYFDKNGAWISSEQLIRKTSLTTPNNGCYAVFSGRKGGLDYLHCSKGVPMYYKRYGQDVSFNTLKKYERSHFGNTMSWAKLGINLFGNSTNYPIYPHGSKWSFISAVYEGFDAILIDVIKTSDDHFVVSHDDDISRYAKNDDGTELVSPFNIRTHTLAELKAVDMGYDYGEMYKGTRIMTLDEALEVVKSLGVPVVVEPEYTLGLTQYERMVRVVKRHGFKENAVFFSYYKSELALVNEIIPQAGLMIYAGATESDADSRIADAIDLKTDKNKVIVNAFADTTNNVLTQTQVQRMIDNGIYYSASTPSSEPNGFLSFINNAPLTEYITHFGSVYIPAYKMLLDNMLN